MRHFFLLVAILSSLTSVGRSGPVPYSEERYSVIWHEAFVFEKSSRSSSAPVSSEEWTVAGIFTLGEADGAVVINRLNGSIEYLNTLSPSPSGMRLTAILGDVGDASLRIAVTLKGKAMVLTGSTADTSVPETVSLKYVPTVIPSPAASIALVE
jgi:hypothetical protein